MVEICLAVFGAVVIIVLTIAFIRISKSELNKLMIESTPHSDNKSQGSDV
jgi:Trk-type K+ transport system membrane component